jgi:chaperonin GroEL
MTLYRLSEEITGTSQADVLIKEVLRAPFKQIVENGEDEFRKVILGYTPTKGYNVISREWEDLFKSGVIDPAKVVKSALKNAFYMGNQILTVEAGIIEERPKGDIQIS